MTDTHSSLTKVSFHKKFFCLNTSIQVSYCNNLRMIFITNHQKYSTSRRTATKSTCWRALTAHKVPCMYSTESTLIIGDLLCYNRSSYYWLFFIVDTMIILVIDVLIILPDFNTGHRRTDCSTSCRRTGCAAWLQCWLKMYWPRTRCKRTDFSTSCRRTGHTAWLQYWL